MGHPVNSNLLLFGDETCGLACVSVGGSSSGVSASASSGKEAVRFLAVGEVTTAVFNHSGTVAFAALMVGSIEVLQLEGTRGWGLALWRSFPISGDNSSESPVAQPAPCGLTYTAWLSVFGSPALMVTCLDRSIRIFAWHGMENDTTIGWSSSSWVDRMLEIKGGDALSCKLVLRLPSAAASLRRLPCPSAFFGAGASHAVCGTADGALSVVDLRTLRTVDSLTAHASRISAVRASGGGGTMLLASADTGGTVVLWGAEAPQSTSDSHLAVDPGVAALDPDSVAEY